MQKEPLKNVQPFSTKTEKTKNGRGLATPFWVDDQDWQNALKYFGPKLI